MTLSDPTRTEPGRYSARPDLDPRNRYDPRDYDPREDYALRQRDPRADIDRQPYDPRDYREADTRPVHTRFYRDKVNGKLMGVCAGIADYTGIDVLWVRLATLVFTFTTGIGIPIYFALGFLSEKKPAALYADPSEQRFWQGVRQSPGRTAREVRASFRDLDRRLAGVEAYYVSHNPRLSDEIEKLR